WRNIIQPMPTAAAETRSAAIFLSTRTARILRNDCAYDHIGITCRWKLCGRYGRGGRLQRIVEGIGKGPTGTIAFCWLDLHRSRNDGIYCWQQRRIQLAWRWQPGGTIAYRGLEGQQTGQHLIGDYAH